jgi:chitosanase
MAQEETIPAPFDPKYVKLIRRILSVAETGKPEWDPAAIYVYSDGKGGRKQCTLSIGFTADGGNLTKVLERYVAAGGAYGSELAPYIAALKAGNPGTDSGFVNLLKEIGKKDPLMMSVQEEMFDKLYLGPAFSWASAHGFVLPLSYLVIADSFLHSGSMLDFLMKRFAEKKPAAGGEGKKWIIAYTKTRKDWLANHSNGLLRNTVYRCNCYLSQIERDNWDLEQTPVVMHGTPVNYT